MPAETEHSDPRGAVAPAERRDKRDIAQGAASPSRRRRRKARTAGADTARPSPSAQPATAEPPRREYRVTTVEPPERQPLSMHVRLYPTRLKAWATGALCDLHGREHAGQLQWCDDESKRTGRMLLGFRDLNQAGTGEFAQRIKRSAMIDHNRARKAHAATCERLKARAERAERDDARTRAELEERLSRALERAAKELAEAVAELERERTSRTRRKARGARRRYEHTRRALARVKAGEYPARKPPKPLPEFKLPVLRAETRLLPHAECQSPRRARHWDGWIHLEGTAQGRGNHPGERIYLPFKRHKALNRALALPGAELAKSAEVFFKNGKLYGGLTVWVPVPKQQAGRGVLGVDVGARNAVASSDGYLGRDLRPVMKLEQRRLSAQQRAGARHSKDVTYQRQVLNIEARKLVRRARRSGLSLALEDPKRLVRWKRHAARWLGRRVQLLAALGGVPLHLVEPAYSSKECRRCGSRETVRAKQYFRCEAPRCGHTEHADLHAARNMRSRVRRALRAAHAPGAKTVPVMARHPAASAQAREPSGAGLMVR